MTQLDQFEVEGQVLRALAEDYRGLDRTSDAVLLPDQRCSAQLISREPGVLCGMALAEAVFRAVDPAIAFSPQMADGDHLVAGCRAFTVSGPARGILIAERTVLNFLQHLSGVATETARYVEIASAHGVEILDTRKTLPGLRRLEKYATAVGGARNHRMGLFDAILIKDNHVDLAGGLTPALARATRDNPSAEVEVEVRGIPELTEALAAGVGRVLLDNFTPQGVEEAVCLVDHRASIEVSGGVELGNLKAYASAGPDFISVGRLTHSVRALDLALKVVAA